MFSLVRTRALFAPCVAGVAILCGTPSVALAQSAPAPAATASPQPEIGHVTTSDRQDEPLDATSRPTYIVTKEHMLLHGDVDVASAIADVPGVLIQRFGSSGAEAVASILGGRGDGILVLMDGRPISGSEIGAIDLGAIPTAGVERIEVVEGAGATLYGNGASSGVINIITTRNRAAYKIPVVSAAAGSFDTSRFALETGTFSFSHEYAANTYPYATAPNMPASATRVNADLNSFNARFIDYGTFGNFSINGSAGFVSRVLGVPGQLGSLTLFARQLDDTQDARVTLAYHHPQAVTTLDLSGTRETLTFQDPSPAEFGPFLDFSTDARVEANLRNNVTSATNRLIYGADLAHGVARNDGGGGIFSSTSYAQTALYVQDSMVLGGTSRLYAGLRGEGDGGAGGAITPSLGGTLGLGGAYALKVNFGTAFRVPTAEDFSFPGFNNPFLQPERTQSFDATVANARILGGASFGWFVQTGTNLITLNPNVDFSMPFGPGNQPLINQQQSSIAGFVLDVATLPFYGIVAKVNVTDLYRALAYNAGVPAQRLPDRPVFTTNFDVGYTGAPHNVLAAAGATAHTVGIFDLGGAGDYTAIDGYLRFRLAQHVLLSFRVNNLGNVMYQEIAGYPSPGRSYVLELSTR